MSDDFDVVFVEIGDEQQQRWQAAAEAEGLPIEVWVVNLLDWRAGVVLGRQENEPA